MMAKTFLMALVAFAALAADQPEDSRERIKWVKGAAKRGAESIPALDNYLRHDPDDTVRVEAVRALIAIGGDSTLDPLIHATNDRDSEVQARATDGIVSVYIPGYYKTGFAAGIKRAGAGIKGRFSDDNGLVVEPGTPVKPEAQVAVGKLVKHGTWPEVRANAARAAGILRARQAVPNLREALKSRDTQLLFEALVALEKIRDPEAAPEVTTLVSDLNEKVQVAAIELAGLLQSKQSLPALQRAFRNTASARVRSAALSAIAMIPDESNRAHFDQALADKDDDMRAAAAEGLGRLGRASDIKRLEQAFGAESHMKPRLGLAFALVKLGRLEVSELSPLQYLVNTLNSALYKGIARPLLAELAADKSVRETLYPALERCNAREKIELAGVLAETGDQASLPALERMAGDSDPKVAQASHRGINAIRARNP
jgi:HEAT repeat protein